MLVPEVERGVAGTPKSVEEVETCWWSDRSIYNKKALPAEPDTTDGRPPTYTRILSAAKRGNTSTRRLMPRKTTELQRQDNNGT